MFERFTDKARRFLVVAQEQARDLEHNYIGTEHLLLAMAWEENNIAHDALNKFTSYKHIREGVEKALGDLPSPGAISSPPFTPRAKKVLEFSLREALQLGHNYIGPEHVILGLIRNDEGGLALAVLRDLGVNSTDIRQEVIRLISEGQYPPTGYKAAADVTLTLSARERQELLQWITDFTRVSGGLPSVLASLQRRLRRP